MRIAAIVLAAVAVAGCASRQSASTELGQTAPPVNYENTVTSYFDLTTRTPLAQRKLQFGAPESTRCRILGSVGGHTGWVVPVTYEVTAPTAGAPPPHSTMSPGLAAAAATAPKPVPVAKGKPAKGKKAAADKNNATPATGAPQTALAALFVQTTPADVPAVALENVSVTGKTRYFFWFDRETINAVTKRMDICP
jgi:hypothetical protein